MGIEIAIDFDGTCVTHEYPSVGRNIGAELVLPKLVANGHRLILFTMRSGAELQAAIDWFERHSILLYGINVNPTQTEWTSSPKAYAHLYIDDAALGAPVIVLPGERPYIDWEAVVKMLQQRRLIS